MPTATQSNTTPTRRSALGFTAAAIIAGLTTPTLAMGVQEVHAPRTITPIAALQRQLTDLTTLRNEMDEALIKMPYGAAYDALHEQFDKSLDDLLALQDRIVALPAETVEDAAIQTAVAYFLADGIYAESEEEAADNRKLRAALASILLAVVSTAGLDIDKLGSGCMRRLCALHGPRGSAVA